MDQILEASLEAIEVGPMKHYRNMIVCCLLTTREASIDFLTMDEALSASLLTISEISEAGSVPQLKVENRSQHKVILLDGEEVSGAKQNRVLNVTVLLGAQSKTMIPVSCVEQGRWSYRSKEFRSESRVMSPRMKQKKSESVSVRLRVDRSYAADQALVWDEIREKHARMATEASPTLAMADLYESHRGSSEEYVSAFHVEENQIGFIVFIGGRITGAELLFNSEKFRSIHQKLIASYAMDALETANLAPSTENDDVLRESTLAFLTSVRDAIVERRQSVVLGLDLRLESPEIMASGLEYDRRVVQMTVFPKSDSESSGKPSGRFQSASLRKAVMRSRL